jgi:precorrin-6B methylase 2
LQLSQLNKNKSLTIANIGCGNSNLALDILTAYPTFTIAIDSYDYSEDVIAEMNGKNLLK